MSSAFAAHAADASAALFAEFGEPVTYAPAGGVGIAVTAIVTPEAVPPGPFSPDAVALRTVRIDLPIAAIPTQPTEGATVAQADGTTWTVRTAEPDSEHTTWICRDVQRA